MRAMCALFACGLFYIDRFRLFSGALPNNDGVNVEFNLWTKPDCAGTPYENLNRSWFFFGIQGINL